MTFDNWLSADFSRKPRLASRRMTSASRSGLRLRLIGLGTVRYNWPMSVHASQAFSIAHCTDLEDLPRRSLINARGISYVDVLINAGPQINASLQ